MGHVNMHVMKQMSKHNNFQDFIISSHNNLPHVCQGCALGKQHKPTYPSILMKKRSKKLGALLHANLCGKMLHASLGGAHYYILIKNDCTSYKFVAFLKAKSDALKFFVKALHVVERDIGGHVRTLRTNQGKEFCNDEFTLFLE